MTLENVLAAPLKRTEAYIHDLQELRSHTPTEHIDYNILQETISELEIIQKVRGDPMVFMVTPSLNVRGDPVVSWSLLHRR
jgi:hypothetical protein